MEYVDTFSEFNRLSIRKKFSTLLRAWYLLRHHHIKINGGSGWLSCEDTYSVLLDIYKKNRLREILKIGENNWWKAKGDGYIIFGTKRIGKKLKHKPGRRVEMPLDAFDSLQKFKAFAYATFFAYESSLYKNEQGKNISRETLSSLFDISTPTQLNYERIASIKVEEQFAYDNIPRFDGETEKYIPESEAIEKYKENSDKLFILDDINLDGYQEAVYQIPNNYFVDTVFYKSNENKRIKNVGGSDQRDGASRNSKLPLYFGHEKQLRKKLKNKSRNHGYVVDKESSMRRGKKIFKKERVF